MLIRWLIASVHLLALGIGLGAVWARAQLLSGELTSQDLKRALVADTWWGIAAVLWIATGLVRLFSSLEKGTVYYLQNDAFLIKMALLIVILALEVWPMIKLIQWRIAVKRGTPMDLAAARPIARLSYVEAGLVVLMVLAATAMARGLGT